VGDRQFDLAQSRGPNAFVADGPQLDPLANEPPAIVVRERRRLTHLAADVAGQQVGLDQHLKAVANADHRLLGVDELAQRLAQVVGDLVGEDLASGNVVAVAEPAGDGEDLVNRAASPGFRATGSGGRVRRRCRRVRRRGRFRRRSSCRRYGG
jgi:hypothetical protein